MTFIFTYIIKENKTKKRWCDPCSSCSSKVLY